MTSVFVDNAGVVFTNFGSFDFKFLDQDTSKKFASVVKKACEVKINADLDIIIRVSSDDYVCNVDLISSNNVYRLSYYYLSKEISRLSFNRSDLEVWLKDMNLVRKNENWENDA